MAVFYWTTLLFSKKLILDKFRKLKKSFKIKIIFAIEAVGISINFPDIYRAVIYIILAPKQYFSFFI
jgi:hypothetical protein